MVEVKRPVRELLEALVRIVDNDLDELRGNIVHVDELHAARWRKLDARVAELEAALADNADHSRKVPS